MQDLIAAEKGEKPEGDLDTPDPISHDINYVIHTWLDHREHGSYPEAGGYNDQDPYLMADWHTMTLYRIRIEHGISSNFPMPTSGPDVSTLMGE